MLDELLGKAVPAIITKQLRAKLLDFRDECGCQSVSEIRIGIYAVDEKVHLEISLYKDSGRARVRELPTEELLGGLMDFKDKVEKAVRMTFLQISDEEKMQCAVTEMFFVITPVMNEKQEHKGNFVIALYKNIGGKKEYVREVKLEEIMG